MGGTNDAPLRQALLVALLLQSDPVHLPVVDALPQLRVDVDGTLHLDGLEAQAQIRELRVIFLQVLLAVVPSQVLPS